MATRLKTVHYAFPTLASLTNNTLTNLTQRTIYLPETGTKTFRSVVAHVTFDDIITATGGTLSTKDIGLRLGAAGYTTVSSASGLTNSGENASFFIAQDFTSHFTTNWTGTSMTCDLQLQINQTTGTTLGMVNVCVTLEITYEYDDTSTTQVKSVMIPLNAPVGALTTGATTYDTFPALDTYLPESSKTYRDIFVVVQGNEHRNAATTDHTMTISVGATTVTTGNYEGALASDRWFRYVFDILEAGFAGGGSTQNFQLHASVARVNHPQAYAVVTYEYDESASTTIMNSLMLPMEVDSPMGGTTSADYQRATNKLWVEEPDTITLQRAAFFVFWEQSTAIAGLNMRIGTGSFVAYTDTASVMCGGNGSMVRNDAAVTLARGVNSFNFDVYRTDTSDLGWMVSGFWILNYTSGKASDGSGSHNHTVMWGMSHTSTGAGSGNLTVSAFAPVLPESEWFLNSVGLRDIQQSSGTNVRVAFTMHVERLSAEGGVQWETAFTDISQNDSEVGVYTTFTRVAGLFKRFTGDAGAELVDLETARRYLVVSANLTAAWHNLSMLLTYHTILSEVAGTVTGSGGGTVNINLHDGTTGEVLKTTSRVGNGAYTIPFYGDTRTCYVTAREGATLLARSDDDVPTLV